MATAAFEAQRAATSRTEVWLVDIVFPAFETLPELAIRAASTQQIVFDHPIDLETYEYEYLLADIPRGFHEAGRSNDRVSINLFNKVNELYSRLLPSSDPSYLDILERAKVTVWRCLDIEQNLFEGERVFRGSLVSLIGNEGDKVLELTALSELSRPGFLVGNLVLTRERCPLEFASIECGWNSALGGNPSSCSKYRRGVDGCEAHNNEARFKAFPALATAEIEIVGAGDIDFPYGTGSCFSDEMEVVTDIRDGRIFSKPFSALSVGEVIVTADAMTFELSYGKIQQVFEHRRPATIVHIDYSGFSLHGTSEHLVGSAPAKFRCLGTLNGRAIPLVDGRGNQIEVQGVRRLTTDLAPTWNLQTSARTYLVTDKDRRFASIVHNDKSDTPINM